MADYRPAWWNRRSKSAERLTIELVRNQDILASVAALKPAPFTVGFAAETEHLESAARAKLATRAWT